MLNRYAFLKIKNIVEAANLQKFLFRQKQDQMKQFMQSHKIPPEVSYCFYDNAPNTILFTIL